MIRVHCYCLRDLRYAYRNNVIPFHFLIIEVVFSIKNLHGCDWVFFCCLGGS